MLGNRLNILLVEDNPGDARLIREMLSERQSYAASYLLCPVQSLEKAIQKCSAEHFDAILLDLNLPDSTGIPTLQTLSGFVHDSPIIVLTGLPDEDVALESVHHGAQDYIIKLECTSQLLTRVIHYAIERKRVEQALQEKNDELERAIAAKDRFLATMSHELRTPLNAIIGFTGVLLMKLHGPLNQNQEKHLTTIQTSGKHLLSLINDLLDLAKIQSGKVELVFEPVVCQDILNEVGSSLRPLANNKGLRFELRLPEDHVLVCTDRRALNQIIINLTNNAIKFTDQGMVTVELEQCRENGRALTQIRVKDTGIGIPAEEQPKLFQAFTQLDFTRSVGRYDGTGLGLHLSQKLASLLGAQLSVQSDVGKGSTFTLLLQES
jgi:signal transduction histidine kinase